MTPSRLALRTESVTLQDYTLYTVCLFHWLVCFYKVHNNYGAVVCFFFFILLLHALLRLYKNKQHSMLEVYLLINIIIIFIITVYNYAYHENIKKTGMCAAGVNLPLHCLHNLSILSLKFIKSFPILSWCKRKATKLNAKETSEVSSDSESLPF